MKKSLLWYTKSCVSGLKDLSGVEPAECLEVIRDFACDVFRAIGVNGKR